MESKKSPKEIRESKGITKKYIYNLLGISRQSLDNKESGKTKFSALEIQKLCDAYNVSVTEIRL